VLAQTSLAARLTGEAKRHADAAIAAGLTDRRAADVLAGLGETRNALVAAGAAAPNWVCAACHTTHDAWQPVCPDCHKAGTFRWSGAGTALA